jgi:hypothetical protein
VLQIVRISRSGRQQERLLIVVESQATFIKSSIAKAPRSTSPHSLIEGTEGRDCLSAVSDSSQVGVLSRGVWIDANVSMAWQK